MSEAYLMIPLDQRQMRISRRYLQEWLIGKKQQLHSRFLLFRLNAMHRQAQAEVITRMASQESETP